MARKIQIKENIVDKAIEYFSPVRAQKRRQARAHLALSGSYVGGAKNRRQTENWNTSSGDADSDILFDLPELRNRSRDLVRNTPLATGAINTKVTSVVGSGLKLRPNIDHEFLGMTEEEAEEWEKHALREYKLFAENQSCSACGNLNMYELQDLVFRSTLENGDTFALLPYIERPDSVYDLSINLVEADRVCNENDQIDSKTLVAGIEKDIHGAAKKFHILTTHPGALINSERKWIKVDAFGKKSGRRNVLHVYRKLRIGQTRGIPDLAPVIETFKSLGDYTEAEITAAVVSGLFTVFVTSQGGGAGSPFEGEKSASDSTGKMGAGAIIDLAEGETVDTANPGRPNSAFDPFVQAILRQIGVALELPFELLIKHFTASYSASRAALLEAWKFFNGRRKWLVDKFCFPVYESFLEEAISKGRINAPGFINGDPAIRQAYLRSEWYGDAKGHIQPLQEIKADQIAVEIGVKTLDEVTAEATGGDWATKHKQRVIEHNKRKADGLIQEPANKAGFLIEEKEEVKNDESD